MRGQPDSRRNHDRRGGTIASVSFGSCGSWIERDGKLSEMDVPLNHQGKCEGTCLRYMGFDAACR